MSSIFVQQIESALAEIDAEKDRASERWSKEIDRLDKTASSLREALALSNGHVETDEAGLIGRTHSVVAPPQDNLARSRRDRSLMPVNQRQREERMDKIVAYLLKNTEPQTSVDVAKALRLPKHKVGGDLRELAHRGVLKSLGERPRPDGINNGRMGVEYVAIIPS